MEKYALIIISQRVSTELQKHTSLMILRYLIFKQDYISYLMITKPSASTNNRPSRHLYTLGQETFAG